MHGMVHDENQPIKSFVTDRNTPGQKKSLIFQGVPGTKKGDFEGGR